MSIISVRNCKDVKSFKLSIILYVSLSLIIYLVFSFEYIKSFDIKGNPLLLDEDNLESKYLNCLNSSYSFFEDSEVILATENLKRYIESNYDGSLLYEDLNSGFSVGINTNKIYYAASTIKVLDALYIYDKVSKGELSLDSELLYTKEFYINSSVVLNKVKYNTKITLRDLVSYAIVYSDNSAHAMLVDFIGKDKLKEFGNSLGATTTLNSTDNFGQINVTDAIIYMKAINEFINNNGELGEELKSFFVQALYNSLEISELNIIAGHKYGYYGSNYHEIGIVYDDNPYVIAILTLEGSKHNVDEIISDINQKVYELHKLFNEKKVKICKSEIYGN